MKFRYLCLIIFFSCSESSDEISEIEKYEDCDFIKDEVYEIDLFEGYLTLKLNNPAIHLRGCSSTRIRVRFGFSISIIHIQFVHAERW